MKYIDFHCHQKKLQAVDIGVVSVDAMQPDAAQFAATVGYATIGIHPWSTDNSHVYKQLRTIADLCRQNNVLGVGEIGLDRLKGASLAVQAQIFREQVGIAHDLNLPVVVHCTRAWSEMMQIASHKRFEGTKMAVHGFRRHPEIAHQLATRGFYVSFGTLLVDPTPELAEALTKVPIDHLFFETDTSEMPVNEVYSAASDILNIPIEQLIKQVEKNFMTFFTLQSLETNSISTNC